MHKQANKQAPKQAVLQKQAALHRICPVSKDRIRIKGVFPKIATFPDFPRHKSKPLTKTA